MKIDKKLIKELTDCLKEFKLTEIEYGNNDLKIKVSKASMEEVTTLSSEKKTNKSIDSISSTELGKKITGPLL